MFCLNCKRFVASFASRGTMMKAGRVTYAPTCASVMHFLMQGRDYGSARLWVTCLLIREILCSYTQWEHLSDYYAGSFPSRAQFARRDSGCSSVGGPYAESIAIFECPWMNMPMFEYPWCGCLAWKWMKMKTIFGGKARVLPWVKYKQCGHWWLKYISSMTCLLVLKHTFLRGESLIMRI